MVDLYHPHIAMAHDRAWLLPRLEALAPENLRHGDLGVYLMLHDYQVLRKALKIALTEHEHLPDLTEGTRTYKHVCRARLSIAPSNDPKAASEPITLIYSANAPPRSRRYPLYIAVNLFEASEPPLSFALSGSERVMLMALGATRSMEAIAKPQTPEVRITKRGLRALRQYLAQEEKRTPNPVAASPAPTDPANSPYVA